MPLSTSVDLRESTLFISLRSPFARRVRVAFLENGISFVEKTFDVFKPTPELYEANPVGRVPTLQCLYESIESGYFPQSLKVDVLYEGAISTGISEKCIDYYLEQLRPEAQQAGGRNDIPRLPHFLPNLISAHPSRQRGRRLLKRIRLAALKCMKPISAVQLLRDDHKKILGLFRQLEVVGERAPEMRDPVVLELFEEFLVHSQVEERLFYPEIYRRIQDKFKVEGNESGLIDQSFSDHQEVAILIQQFFKKRVEEKIYDGSKLQEMSGLVQAHIVEEEKRLFPFVEKNFADGLEELGAGMLALKKDLREANHIPDASNPSHAQNLDGGEQRRFV